MPAEAKPRDSEKKESEMEKYRRKRPKQKNTGPCRVITNACIQAGFVKDGPRGKDAKKDCLEVLILGGSVKGVYLIPGIIESCKMNLASETGE